MSRSDVPKLGETRQVGAEVRPYTFKGILANAAVALVRIAAALERIAAAQERSS